jgi:hypothetical protein
MQENMKQMQTQMVQIPKVQNPEERQKLLQQHWATMQNSMGMMRGMWHGVGMEKGMMGGSMMGSGKMRSYYSKLTPEQQKQHQYMSYQYMGMQQIMIDHMMQHQYWSNQSAPAKK